MSRAVNRACDVVVNAGRNCTTALEGKGWRIGNSETGSRKTDRKRIYSVAAVVTEASRKGRD